MAVILCDFKTIITLQTTKEKEGLHIYALIEEKQINIKKFVATTT